MASVRPYRARRRSTRAQATREKIVEAVGQLLAEGVFHEATMDEVAERAGIARATLYQHFRSRLELVDAICDTFAASPDLRAIRETIRDSEPSAALEMTIEHSVRFWSSGRAAFDQLYGVIAIDPSARQFVERQNADRRDELAHLVGRLRDAHLLRQRLTPVDAAAELMVLTSYASYQELRAAGMPDTQITKILRDAAHRLLLR
jgi:AcrR family transcriptional regulator